MSTLIQCFLSQPYRRRSILRRKYHRTFTLDRDYLSVAIVGTGPSGFYTAKYLQSALKKTLSSQDGKHFTKSLRGLKQLDIDLIERLPTPFGLVRSGVAPDHPEVKNVEKDFETLFDCGSLAETDQVFRSVMEFRGNVTIGRDVSLKEMKEIYDVVVLAYGCESDRKLGIEGESWLKGIYSAREFVAWYNGHPDYVHLGQEISESLGRGKPENSHVVIIGQGNVALDCARILAKGKKKLFGTDIASHSLPILKDGVKITTVIGRRGHVQGAFTIKELRELTKLEEEGCHAFLRIKGGELSAGTTSASLDELKKSRPKSRIDQLLCAASVNKKNEESWKEIVLRFMLSPIKFKPDPNDPLKLGSILSERCELKGEPFQQVAVSTGNTEEIKADMALVSIGYKGKPLPGMDPKIFDEKKGVVRNQNGRVHEETGMYVTGWLKRGANGIIGTNISDAKDTVTSIIEDLVDNKIDISSNVKRGRQGLDSLLSERNIKSVDWAKYKKIDMKEKDPARLRCKSQPREKITSLQDMLAIE